MVERNPTERQSYFPDRDVRPLQTDSVCLDTSPFLQVPISWSTSTALQPARNGSECRGGMSAASRRNPSSLPARK